VKIVHETNYYYKYAALSPLDFSRTKPCINKTILRVSWSANVVITKPCIRCTHVCRLAVVISVEDVACQSEVGDFDDEVLSDKHVPRSQVAVNTLHAQTRRVSHRRVR